MSGKHGACVYKAEWIAERVTYIEGSLAPGAGGNAVFYPLAACLVSAGKERLQIVDREIQMFLIGTGIEAIPIRLRVEASQNNPATVKVVSTR